MKLKRFFEGALVGLVLAVLVVPQGNVFGQDVETKTKTVQNSVTPSQNDQAKGVPESKVLNPSKGLEKKINFSDLKQSFVPGEVIVKFKQNRIDLKRADGPARLQQFATRKNLTTKDSIRRSNLAVYKVKAEESVEQVIARLKADPDVEYVEPNYIRRLSGISTNDIFRDQLWALENTGQAVDGISGANNADIDGKEAWAFSEGDGVIVAVIDTGVAYNHPDLFANMWDGTNCKDQNGTVLGGCNHGYDFEDSDKVPLPTSSSHGTHVAGTIAAEMNNGMGIIGVAPGVKIMALKFGLDVASEVQAIDFAIQNGAQIINASFSDSFFSQTEHDAIKDFLDQGGLFVTVAGNYGSDHGVVSQFPCDYDMANIVCVAATDQNDGLASFSDYGVTSVDVGAPGVNILSTIADSTAMFENFNSVSAPNLPGGWIKTGNWGTFDFSGNKVLYSDYANTPYAPNANSTATSPTINLSGASGASINFLTQCDTEYTTTDWFDYMSLEASGNGSDYTELVRWDEAFLDGLNGDPVDPTGAASFYIEDLEIPSQFLSANFNFRFRWVTDLNNVPDLLYDGCLVDEIALSKLSDGSDEFYDYSDGTSMAAPHVAGLAALLMSHRPDLTSGQFKQTILDTGDTLAPLVGKTVSGKRVNAFNALDSVTPPVVSNVQTASTTPTSTTIIWSTDELATSKVAYSTSTPVASTIVSDNALVTNHSLGLIDLTASTTYYFYVESVDEDGNVATSTEQSFITLSEPEVDLTPPVIVLLGDNPFNLTVGDVFVEPGYTATDDVDGEITDNVVIGGDAVNTAVVGAYQITYNVSDSSGNPAAQVVRIVNVEEPPPPDTTAPVIILSGSPTVNLLVGDTYTEEGATALDDVDGDISANIVIGGDVVDTSTPGTYIVTYNVSDNAGNPADEVTRTVIVAEPVDSTPPAVTEVSIASDNTNPAFAKIGDYVQIAFTASEEIAWLDVSFTSGGQPITDIESVGTNNVSGNSWLASYIVNVSDSEGPVGFSVDYEDAAGNAGITLNSTTDGSAVIVDMTPPIITQPSGLLVEATSAEGATVEYLLPEVTDNVDTDLLAVCAPLSGLVFPLGDTVVGCNAVDSSANAADPIEFLVTVQDTTPPAITLAGGATMNVILADDFTDPGATAFDTVDEDVSGSIVISGDTVATSTAGTYLINYDVSDAAGNVAEQVTRTVIVSDLIISEQEQSAISTNSITIAWTTTHPSTSRVIFDTASHTTASTTEASPPNYGYANSTAEDATLVIEHSVNVTSLSASTTYYFRSVSHGSPEVVGNEISVATSAAPPPPAPSGGGGGGGGGGGSGSVLTNLSILINGNATTTNSQNVTLTLTATNATQMVVLNDASFGGVVFEPFATTKAWTLTAGNGAKIVYVKFRNASGNESATITDAITLEVAQGQVLGEQTSTAHPNGTLILDSQTIFIIKNGQRHGFRNPEEYFSHGYAFRQAVTASDADRALPEAAPMKALEGTLVLDATDGRTVYMIGVNGAKRGFTSAEVFHQLGYSFEGLLTINLSDYTAGLVISSSSETHPEGALVLESIGTVWWIRDGVRMGFESEAVFRTYGFTFSRVVVANTADMGLPEGSRVKFRDGTLVNDNGAVYVISDGKKIGFRTMNALTSRGYQIDNSISAQLNNYDTGQVLD